MKKGTFALAAVALSALPTFAAPIVTDVTMATTSNQLVEVTYTLSEDAVVTFDILTNASGGAWVSIGPQNVTYVSGDVNRLVSGVGRHAFVWSPANSGAASPAVAANVRVQVRAWPIAAPPPYMVIDLSATSGGGSTTADCVRYYESVEWLPDGGLTNDIYRTERLVMRRIPARDVTWRMGSPSAEKWHEWGNGGKETPHYVTLSEDYYMAVFETTEMQYHYMNLDHNPSAANAVKPKAQVSFNALRGNASIYDFGAVDPSSPMQALRTRTGFAFDLPTEAQWEFACRAGEDGPFSPAIDLTDTALHSDYTANFTQIGWCTESASQIENNVRYRVGEKLPNAWGLYDMHGNVSEMCVDWYKSDLGSASAIDPVIPAVVRTADWKIVRGGSAGWCHQYKCRSAFRAGHAPSDSFGNCGFRLVCPTVRLNAEDVRAWNHSLDEFPRLAGETDDSPRLQRAVDACPSGVLHVGPGVYEIADMVSVTNLCSLEMDKSAVLRAVAEIPFVLRVNGEQLLGDWEALPHDSVRRQDYGMFVTGGRIDGRGLASCMALDGFRHYTLRDVTFLNGKAFGLAVDDEDGTGYELIAENLYFKCFLSGLAGNTALFLNGGDCHVTDCISVDYTVGFHLARGGANRLTRCHVWGGPIRESLDNSVCFKITSRQSILRDCYADTGKTGFEIDAKYTRLLGCSYISNTSFGLDGITVIRHLSGRLLVADGSIVKSAEHFTVYDGCGTVKWRDMMYSGFSSGDDTPGVIDFGD